MEGNKTNLKHLKVFSCLNRKMNKNFTAIDLRKRRKNKGNIDGNKEKDVKVLSCLN